VVKVDRPAGKACTTMSRSLLCRLKVQLRASPTKVVDSADRQAQLIRDSRDKDLPHPQSSQATRPRMLQRALRMLESRVPTIVAVDGTIAGDKISIPTLVETERINLLGYVVIPVHRDSRANRFASLEHQCRSPGRFFLGSFPRTSFLIRGRKSRRLHENASSSLPLSKFLRVIMGESRARLYFNWVSLCSCHGLLDEVVLRAALSAISTFQHFLSLCLPGGGSIIGIGFRSMPVAFLYSSTAQAI